MTRRCWLAPVGLLGLALGVTPAVAAAKTICFVTFSLQIAYFQSSVAGGKKTAKELGKT
jgi:ABC-type sugar transport system substrate-binding protein